MRSSRFKVCLLACLWVLPLCLIRSATINLPGPGARQSSQGGLAFPSDDLESYTDAASVNGLNGGNHWNGPYVDRFAPTGIYDLEDFESYADGVAANGLNGGNLGWNGAYVDHDGLFGIKASDDFEPYSDAASLNGLNGGSDWGGAFVDR